MIPDIPQRVKVLVAEDDALVSEGTAEQLTRLGYSLAGAAYDGPEAVKMAAELRPSVILMDLQMVDPDTGREDPRAGLKATRLIQDLHPAPVVVLTAHESPDLLREATDAGANGYLVKPTGELELSRAISIARARFRDLLVLRRYNGFLQLRNRSLKTSLERARSFTGFITACANCRRVKESESAWVNLERYVAARTDARFSHGLCPQCATQLYPDIFPEQGS